MGLGFDDDLPEQFLHRGILRIKWPINESNERKRLYSFSPPESQAKKGDLISIREAIPKAREHAGKPFAEFAVTNEEKPFQV